MTYIDQVSTFTSNLNYRNHEKNTNCNECYNILFIERNRKVKITLDKFFEMWTGNTLIAETDKTSKEPYYEIHFREELFQNLRKIAILFILLFLFAFAFIINRSYAQMWVMLFLLIIAA